MEEKKSAFSSFNHLVLLKIAKYLHPQDIVRTFLKLNKATHTLGTHNALWRKILIYEAVAAAREPNLFQESKHEESDESHDEEQHEEKKMTKPQKEIKDKYLSELHAYFGAREPNYYEYYLSKKNLLKGIYRSDAKVTQCLGHTDCISAIHSEGRQFVTGSYDKKIILWKLGKKRKGYMFEGHSNIVTGVHLFTQFNKLISCSVDRSVRIWDIKHIEDAEYEKFSSAKKIAGYAHQAGSATYPSQVYQKLKSAPHLYGVKGIRKIDKSHALTYSREDKCMCVWDINKAKLGQRIQNNWSAPLINVAVTQAIVASMDQGTVFIHDLETAKEVMKFQWQEDALAQAMPTTVNPLIFSTDDPNSMFLGAQGFIKRFDLRSPLKKAEVWNKAHPTEQYKLDDSELLKEKHYTLLNPGGKATRPLKIFNVENTNLLVTLMHSSKGVLVHDLRMTEKQAQFHRIQASEVTCIAMGKSTETKGYVAAGGIENEFKVVDVRRAPDDQYFRGKGKLVPHLGSSMTHITFQDEFIGCAAKDGSVSVMEFTGRKKSLEPRVVKINAFKQ